jgi:hypothetical protein
LSKLRPRDAAGTARRRVAAELITYLERIYQRSKAADKELRALVTQTGTSLRDLHGIGPSAAARLLVEVGDITRFPSKAHFASWTGTATDRRLRRSGDHVRHRLSRGGNRQIDRVLHTMAIVQQRRQTERTPTPAPRSRMIGAGWCAGLGTLSPLKPDSVKRVMSGYQQLLFRSRDSSRRGIDHEKDRFRRCSRGVGDEHQCRRAGVGAHRREPCSNTAAAGI